MNRRLIASLIVLAIGLQGPILAYATTAISAVSTMTTPADCCPGHESGLAGNGCSSCLAGVVAGECCGGSVVFAAILGSHISLLAPLLHLLPSESGSVSFATERPGPQLRPPIV